MTESKKDYSDYLHHLGLMESVYTLVCGFTFTTTTLLVTTLPDAKEMRAQLILLFLTTVFDLFVYLIIWGLTEDGLYCSCLPPMSRRQKVWGNLTLIGLILWGLSIPAMFLLWRLGILALITAIIWMFLVPIGYSTLYKRSSDYRKTMGSKS